MADHQDAVAVVPKTMSQQLLNGDFVELNLMMKPCRFDDNRWIPNREANMKAQQFITYPPAYPNMGLFHPVADYKAAWPDILNWTLRRQCDFCDVVTYRYSQNAKFVDTQTLKMLVSWPEVTVDKLNACSVGNSAFLLTMNPKHAGCLEVYQKILELGRKLQSAERKSDDVSTSPM